MQRSRDTSVFAGYSTSRTCSVSTGLLRGDLLFRLCGRLRYWHLFYGDVCIATGVLDIRLSSKKCGQRGLPQRIMTCYLSNLF